MDELEFDPETLATPEDAVAMFKRLVTGLKKEAEDIQLAADVGDTLSGALGANPVYDAAVEARQGQITRLVKAMLGN